LPGVLTSWLRNQAAEEDSERDQKIGSADGSSMAQLAQRVGVHDFAGIRRRLRVSALRSQCDAGSSAPFVSPGTGTAIGGEQSVPMREFQLRSTGA
jgi:hypothetical protein